MLKLPCLVMRNLLLFYSIPRRGGGIKGTVQCSVGVTVCVEVTCAGKGWSEEALERRNVHALDAPRLGVRHRHAHGRRRGRRRRSRGRTRRGGGGGGCGCCGRGRGRDGDDGLLAAALFVAEVLDARVGAHAEPRAGVEPRTGLLHAALSLRAIRSDRTHARTHAHVTQRKGRRRHSTSILS